MSNYIKTKEELDAENRSKLLRRETVFLMASQLVGPIVEKHGLEPTKSAWVQADSGYTITAVEQHLDHILRVANWLLEEQ